MFEEGNEIIEKAVGELYRGFFLLREEDREKEELQSMMTIRDMLDADIAYLRKKQDANV